MSDQNEPIMSSGAGLYRSYASIHSLDTLGLAFAQLQSQGWLGNGEAPSILRSVGEALQARSYQAGTSGDADEAIARDQLVQAALAIVLAANCRSDSIFDPRTEKVAAEWVATTIEGGQREAYAIDFGECFRDSAADTILKQIRFHDIDPEIVALLTKVLTSSHPAANPLLGPLAGALADILYAPVDQTLKQIRGISLDGSPTASGARLGSELVVLVDTNARNEWVLPAARERLREDFARLGHNLTMASDQQVNLSEGGQLKVFGHKFRAETGGRGLHVTAHPIAKSRSQINKHAASRNATSWAFRLSGAKLAKRRFGRAAKWFAFPARVASPAGRAVVGALGHLHAIELSWRILPLLGRVGLKKAWGVIKAVRKRWPEVAVGACGFSALICLLVLTGDLYSQRSGEKQVEGKPLGFYLGQVNTDPPWGETIPYGLYMPPHFEGRQGPFPLVVFLHGYGDRTSERLFTQGVAKAIHGWLREGKIERCEFVGLFPIDPDGKWDEGSAAMADTIRVLDYVVAKHRIDPARVYLTGVSNGASGVWRMAEAYPDRWAAVAPVSSFYQPNVSKVRHIPAWIHHGAKDKYAPVGPERTLVGRLKKAGADVKYTEYPNQGHTPWMAFEKGDLYDWFLTKRLVQS